MRLMFITLIMLGLTLTGAQANQKDSWIATIHYTLENDSGGVGAVRGTERGVSLAECDQAAKTWKRYHMESFKRETFVYLAGTIKVYCASVEDHENLVSAVIKENQRINRR